MFKIDLEDVAANAFITQIRSGQLNEHRFISYKDLDKYANGVVLALREKGLQGCVRMNRNLTSWVLYYFGDYFVEGEFNDSFGLQLQANITEDDLLQKFTGYLSLDLLLAYRSEIAIKELVA